MSEIKALEKLRNLWGQLSVSAYNDELLADMSACIKATEVDMSACIKAIEAEIADNYIRLPCDADGVPWTLEAKSFIDEAGRKGKFSGLQVDREGRWKIINVCVNHDPSLCHHVKPDPLKELLHDACMNATRIRCGDGVWPDVNIEVDETELASYAERIRELLVRR